MRSIPVIASSPGSARFATAVVNVEAVLRTTCPAIILTPLTLFTAGTELGWHHVQATHSNALQSIEPVMHLAIVVNADRPSYHKPTRLLDGFNEVVRLFVTIK